MSVALRLLERRRSGVLLHPTSLLTGDGADARGALGAAAISNRVSAALENPSAAP
jgi:hypothetical protein